jgi:2-dehydro-3-deoxy-L-rhamnonate dehydrogenase (NAD+)
MCHRHRCRARHRARAVALAFAREGAVVCLVARDEQRLAKAEVEITSAGGKAWTWPRDVRDEHQVDGLVAAAVERWAAIDDHTPFLEIEPARWRAVIDTNLNAPFLLAQRVARHMAAAGGGVLLHTASVDASGPDGPYAAYNSSKAGLLVSTGRLRSSSRSMAFAATLLAPASREQR